MLMPKNVPTWVLGAMSVEVLLLYVTSYFSAVVFRPLIPRERPRDPVLLANLALDRAILLSRGKAVITYETFKSIAEFEPRSLRLAGFEYSDEQVDKRIRPMTGPVRRIEVHCPLWLPLLLVAAHPAHRLLRGPVARWHRRRRGLCERCAYSLAGHTTGVCPECGKPIEITRQPVHQTLPE